MSEILPTLEMVFLFAFFQSKGVNLTCVRNCVVVAEERPRINLTTAFSTLFSGLGLSPRAVSTSFGCRVNVAICTQVKMLASSIVNVVLQITCQGGSWDMGVIVLLSVIPMEGYLWYQFSKWFTYWTVCDVLHQLVFLTYFSLMQFFL